MSKFVDRNTQFPNRKMLDVRSVTRNNMGEIETLCVDELRYEGCIYQEGTPLNAEKLNTIIGEMIEEDRNQTLANQVKEMIERDRNQTLANQVKEMIEEDRNETLANQVKEMIEEDRNETLANQVKEMIERDRNQTINFLCTPAQKIKLDCSKIEMPSFAFFDFLLPQKGIYGTTFSWHIVSGTAITIQNGTALVNRTMVDESVVLGLTLTNEEISENTTFIIRVPKIEYADNCEDISLTFYVYPDGSSASIDSRTLAVEENSGILLRNEHSDIFHAVATIWQNNLLNIMVSCFDFLGEGGITTYDFTVKIGNKTTGQYTKSICCTVEILETINPED